MRIRPIRTLWPRWWRDRVNRAVDNAWRAEVARAREEREIRAAIDDHYEQHRPGGQR